MATQVSRRVNPRLLTTQVSCCVEILMVTQVSRCVNPHLLPTQVSRCVDPRLLLISIHIRSSYELITPSLGSSNISLQTILNHTNFLYIKSSLNILLITKTINLNTVSFTSQINSHRRSNPMALIYQRIPLTISLIIKQQIHSIS